MLRNPSLQFHSNTDLNKNKTKLWKSKYFFRFFSRNASTTKIGEKHLNLYKLYTIKYNFKKFNTLFVKKTSPLLPNKVFSINRQRLISQPWHNQLTNVFKYVTLSDYYLSSSQLWNLNNYLHLTNFRSLLYAINHFHSYKIKFWSKHKPNFVSQKALIKSKLYATSIRKNFLWQFLTAEMLSYRFNWFKKVLKARDVFISAHYIHDFILGDKATPNLSRNMPHGFLGDFQLQIPSPQSWPAGITALGESRFEETFIFSYLNLKVSRFNPKNNLRTYPTFLSLVLRKTARKFDTPFNFKNKNYRWQRVFKMSKKFKSQPDHSKIASFSYAFTKTPTRMVSLPINLLPIWKTTTPSLLFNFSFSRKIIQFTLIFKYLFLTNNVNKHFQFTAWTKVENKFFSTSRIIFLGKVNIFPASDFNFSIQKRAIRTSVQNSFRLNVRMWYHTHLIRFLEHCTGKKINLKLNPFLQNAGTFDDIARAVMWFPRVIMFRKMLGPKIFLKDSILVLNLALRYKDSSFLTSWMRAMLDRIGHYGYKKLLRFLKFMLKHLFYSFFPDLEIKGIKWKFKGKISVSGNSRTRTVRYALGSTSHSTFTNKIDYDLSFINTFTGAIGFQLWLFY